MVGDGIWTVSLLEDPASNACPVWVTIDFAAQVSANMDFESNVLCSVPTLF